MSQAYAQSSRVVLSPTADAPARLLPGETLQARVRVASGLTPPPGRQQSRALEGFAARLCAEGLGPSLPSRVCVALDVHDVRPLHSHTLDYVVTVNVPSWFAEGAYDVGLRFAGGAGEVAEGVWLGSSAVLGRAQIDTVSPSEFRVLSADAPAWARFHLAPGERLDVRGAARVRATPFPSERCTFTAGQVVVLTLGPRSQVNATVVPAEGLPNWTLDLPSRVLAGQSVTPRLRGRPAPDAAFLRYETPQGGDQGAPFRVPGRVVTQAWAYRGGTARLLEGASEVRPRRVGGCDISSRRGPGLAALGLLVGPISGTLRRRRRLFGGLRG